MKRLDLSCLPLNLEVGETMELIDNDGKYHLLQCVKPERNNSCAGCFFTKIKIPFNCDRVKCSVLERKDDVIYAELPVKNEFKEEREMKILTVDELTETEEIKAGETFIYVDGFNKEHKIKVQPMRSMTVEETCKKCAFNNDSCCLAVCSSVERQDDKDVYFEELD